MELENEDTRRWFCRKDNLAFVASEGGWIQERRNTASDLFQQAPGLSSKSYGTGLVLNFLLVGAGVIYAGDWRGIAYTVLTVVFVFISWPVAVLVVVASYSHTVIAIDQRNKKATKQVSAPFMGIDGSSIRSGDLLCPRCGLQLREGSMCCRRCGKAIVERGSPVSPNESDKTRVY
jgi:hypothetical protein